MITTVINGKTVYGFTRHDVTGTPRPFAQAAETWVEGKNKDSLSDREINELKNKYKNVNNMETPDAINVFGSMVEAGLMTREEAAITWYGIEIWPMTPEEMANETGIIEKCAPDYMGRGSCGTVLSRKEEQYMKKLSENSPSEPKDAIANLVKEFKSGKSDFSTIMSGIVADKPMNWDADGTSQLTSEQITYLKSTYDLSNMTKQDYYNLMADLTNMNVISARDVVSQYVAPLPVGPGQVLVTSGTHTSAMQRVSRHMGSSGNLFDNLSQYMEALDSMREWLRDNHSNMDSSLFFSFRNYLDDRSSLYGRFQDIFELLA